MHSIKAIIADDEGLLRISLKEKLAVAWPELEICDEAEDGPQAVEIIKRHRPDIAFLDIRMPGLSGIDVAREILGACRVVFITAYDQYALEAFENEAVDYILKPVSDERLEKTIQRIKRQQSGNPEVTAQLSEAMSRVLSTLEIQKPPAHLRWIKAQHGNGIRLIQVDDVQFFKASDKYTLVITKEGESLIRKSISSLTDELDPDQFWRIHRGTIVNVRQIQKVSRSITGRYTIKLKDNTESLAVSRTYGHLFKQM
jgi:DNA-binding LytR/AlgR family response regulator